MMLLILVKLGLWRDECPDTRLGVQLWLFGKEKKKEEDEYNGS